MYKCFFYGVLLNSLLLNNPVGAIKCLDGQYVEANGKVVIDNLISRECTENFICKRYDIFAALNDTVTSKRIISKCNIITVCVRFFLKRTVTYHPKNEHQCTAQ